MLQAFKQRLKSAVLEAIPSSRLIRRGPATKRQVALTFDDGPDDKTLAYLDCLDELGVRATFFLVGWDSKRAPDLVREYVRRGHQIGGHGYYHLPFTEWRLHKLRDQLDRTNEVLGPQPTARPWVRPPYGTMDTLVLGQLIAHGSMIALWSLDSHDYEVHDSDALVARCSPDNVQPGEVILMHEGQQWTIDALPKIVEQLRGAGYEFVTMAEMMGPE